MAVGLHRLGIVTRMQGNYSRSAALLTEALDRRRRFGSRQGVAASLTELGCTVMAEGDLAQAARMLHESLILFREIGGCRGTAGCLESVARLAALLDRPEETARVLGAAAALREATGEPLMPSERAAHESMTEAARATLGNDLFAAAWTDGQRCSLDEAYVLALDGTLAGFPLVESVSSTAATPGDLPSVSGPLE